MDYSISNILRKLPKNETFNEVRFHIRELMYDLQSIVEELQDLSDNINNLQVDQATRNILINVSSGIEHDVTHHLAQLIQLFGKLIDDSALIEAGEKLSHLKMDLRNAIDDSCVHEIMTDVGNSQTYIKILTDLLDASLQIISGIASNEEDLEERLKETKELKKSLYQLAEALGDRVWLESQKLYRQFFKLYRSNHPDEVEQEDYYNIAATPLHEDHHPSARSLSLCPRCGNSLTIGDRTFEGSYCESCRTTWIEMPAQTS